MIPSAHARHTLSTPEALDREELLARWVGRGPLLRGLVDRLQRGAGEGPPHRLVVGAPGTGRSALLRRLSAAVAASGELAGRWQVLALPSRPWGLARLSDLWLLALEILAEELNHSAAQARITELRALPNDSQVEAGALEALVDLAGRPLLLLVDGLDKLLAAGLELGELATRLKDEPRLTLVASADAPIKERRLHGLFKTETLEPLSLEEAREMLLRQARSTHNADVEKLLLHAPERLAGLHSLIGGRPSDLAQLFAVWAVSTEGDAGTDLLRWVDARAPELRGRMSELAPQAQQIVRVVAESLDPSSAGRVADETRLDVRLVSAQINRLVQNGVLDKVKVPWSARLGFQLNDRPLCWYLLRSRRGRARLEGLAELRARLANEGPRPVLAPYLRPESEAPSSAAARQKALAAVRAALPKARGSWPAPWSPEAFAGVLISAPVSLYTKVQLAEALPELPEASLSAIALDLALRLGQLGLLFGDGFNRLLAQAFLGGEMAGPADLVGAEAAGRRLRSDSLARAAALWSALEHPSLESLNATGSRLGARLSAGESLLWAVAASRARNSTLLSSASALAWSNGATDPSFPFAWLLLAGENKLPSPALSGLEAKAIAAHPGLQAALGLAQAEQSSSAEQAINTLRRALAALRDPEEVAGRLPDGLASYYFDSLEDGSLGRELMRQLRAAPRRCLARLLLGQPDHCAELLALLEEEPDPTGALLRVLLDALRKGQAPQVLAFLSQAGLADRWFALHEAARSRAERSRDPIEALSPEARAVAEAVLAAL